MFCPNCGSENSNERRFCFNCGRAFVSAREEVASNDNASAVAVAPTVERNEFLDSLSGYRSDSAIAPFEAIFVPSTEEEPATHPPGREPVFEDEEADDVFEQSLSGLKLDAVEDDVTAPISEEPEIGEPAVITSPQTPEPIQAGPLYVVPEPTFTHEAITTVETTSVVEPRKTGGKLKFLFGALGIFAVALLSFATGSLATMALFELPPEIPNTIDLPVEASTSFLKVPPEGMVFVPGGEFMMGSNDGDVFSRPAHIVDVGSFYIDRTEVTNEAYFEFVKKTGHEAPFSWVNGKFPDGTARYPVTGVTWYDAAEFAAWSGKRLPSEAEWEFAARGSDGRIYPWGGQWDQSMANAAKTATGVREVGHGGQSPFGLYDMAGNAWEWTASNAKSFPNGKEVPWSRLRLKIIRGGNWQSDNSKASSVFRGFYGAAGEKEYNGTGFRCVKDLPKE